jgi:primosomal replication protein N
LPAVDVSLRHESEILQLGEKRKVSVELRAKSIGAVTDLLLAAPLGIEHVFEGFVCSQRNGRGIVFHIQSIELK